MASSHVRLLVPAAKKVFITGSENYFHNYKIYKNSKNLYTTKLLPLQYVQLILRISSNLCDQICLLNHAYTDTQCQDKLLL